MYVNVDSLFLEKAAVKLSLKSVTVVLILLHQRFSVFSVHHFLGSPSLNIEYRS